MIRDVRPVEELARPRGRSELADDLVRRLVVRYALPEWHLVTEFGMGLDNRRADAVAFNLWRSRGLEVHGFEVKVAREDLVAELRNPGKAEPLWSRCDRWHLVVPSMELVEGLELPPTWGILVKSGRGLAQRRKAERRPGGGIFGRSEAAAFMRRAAAELSSARQHALDEVRAEVEELAAREAERKVGDLGRRVRELEHVIAAFEKAAGVSLSGWSALSRADELGRVARALHTSGFRQRYPDVLEEAAGTMAAAVRALERAGKTTAEVLERVRAALGEGESP